MLEGKLETQRGLASIDFYLQSHNKCYPHVFLVGLLGIQSGRMGGRGEGGEENKSLSFLIK